MNAIVDGGAVPALVRHLQAPPVEAGGSCNRPFEHEVEKGSAFALGLLAVKVIITTGYLILPSPLLYSRLYACSSDNVVYKL